MQEIPYKIYLNEDEMPKQWYNVRADMKNKPAPLLNPATMQPMTENELSAVTVAVVRDVVWSYIASELNNQIGDAYAAPQGRLTVQ